MEKIIKKELGHLVNVTDIKGTMRSDWRESYRGDGLIVLFEICGEDGEKYQFIRFYINEPESLVQCHLTTSAGSIVEDDGTTWVFATRNSLYTFAREHSMSKLEAEVLIINVWHELGQIDI